MPLFLTSDKADASMIEDRRNEGGFPLWKKITIVVLCIGALAVTAPITSKIVYGKK